MIFQEKDSALRKKGYYGSSYSEAKEAEKLTKKMGKKSKSIDHKEYKGITKALKNAMKD